LTTLIFGRDEELATWAEKSGIGPFQRPLTTIGVMDKDDKIMAVAIYNNYRHHFDIEVSFVAATPRWATQGNIRAMLHYPFVQLGVKRLSAITTKQNKRCRKLLTGLGFKQEGVHPFAGENGTTAITYGLYSEPAKKWVNHDG
jgi:RimJ/RimL family protein N-acetyltransferase